MKTKLTALLLIAALCVSHGGHLLMLQYYGWGLMLNNFLSSTQSIEQAVEMTFSGDYACDICNIVFEGLEDNKEDKAMDDYLVLENKPIILGLESRFSLVFPENYRRIIESRNDSFNLRFEAPPLQPPRV